MGDPGIVTSAPPSARPSLNVSVIGLLLAPVMNTVDQTPRKDSEVRSPHLPKKGSYSLFFEMLSGETKKTKHPFTVELKM